MITIAILREAGLSDAQIIRILEIADQHKALSGAERTRQWRARKKAGDDVTSHRHNVTVTSHVTDALSLKREDLKEEKKESAPKRGMRLPPDWKPSDLDWQFALNAVGEPLAKANLEKFRDYWRDQPGQKGTKLDWAGTWRNWVRRVAEGNPASVPAKQEINAYAQEQLRLAEEYRQQRAARLRASDQGELLGPGNGSR
jgi:hypothetical protein